MVIKLKFNNPVLVSSEHYNRDKLYITVLENELFWSEETLLRVPLDFAAVGAIPPQLEDNQATEVLQTIATLTEITGQTTLVANFIANMIISGALNFLWGMVNCLQIIAHYPLINVFMPANC